MDGVIKNCYNSADVYLTLNVDNTTIEYESRFGGIVGVNETSGYLGNVYNRGKINVNNRFM